MLRLYRNHWADIAAGEQFIPEDIINLVSQSFSIGSGFVAFSGVWLPLF